MKINSKYIWDYDTKNLDLQNPNILIWYLSRKINYGEWQKLDNALIEKHLNQLDIDPTLKKMLKKYYAQKRTKTHS